MHELVLHHYPQSPVAEKVRKVLGLKRLAWRSVLIPRVPPKPDLVPLTGGYRLTPVLQVGADIYCDSQCIIRELDRRHPDPALFPGNESPLSWGLSRWTDGAMFTSAVAVVLGAQGSALPREFAEDRGRLYFGEHYNYQSMLRDIPHHLGQLRAQFGWLEEHLASGREYMCGEAPGLTDALVYYLVWFLRGRYEHGPALIDSFPNLSSWETRVDALGQGYPTELESGEALAIARESTADPVQAPNPEEPLSLETGQRIAVSSITDDGTDPVIGPLAALNRDEVAVRHRTPEVGEVVIHFPRVGYRIEAV